MPDSFGARLRQRREERQIDLIAIAGQTKIKLSLLEALERDDVSNWPSGLFRRAYVRTYAQMIGLDPDTTLREFQELYPDPGCDVLVGLPGALGVSEDPSFRSGGPPTRLRTIVESALDSLSRLRRPPGSDTTNAPVAAPNLPVPAFFDVPPAPAASSPAVEVTPSTAVMPEVAAAAGPPQLSVTANTTEATAVDVTTVAGVTPVADDVTLETVARLSTELGRVADRHEIRQLLADCTTALQATGLILWLWNEGTEELRPVLAHGYSDRVLSHLPAVERNDDNATAVAFRTASTRVVAADAHTGAALVVPLLIPDGCAGVLAIELKQGTEATRSLRAVASLLAAALIQLVHRSRPAEVRAPVEPAAPAVARFRAPARPARVRR